MYYNKIETVNSNTIENIFNKDLLNFIYKNFYLSLFNEYLNILKITILNYYCYNDANYDNETNK